MVNKSLSLIGVPTDIGAGHRGASMGPEALRVANRSIPGSRRSMAIGICPKW
jgi:arginase